MIVIPGPSSLGLGWRVAERLGVEPTPVEHRVFPDGESYIKLTKPVAGEDVAIVQTTAPNPDMRFMQLLLMARTAKDFGAENIVAVVPYLAYARQDKRFTELEALSLDVIFGLLEASGVTDLVTINIHNEASTRGVEAKHGVRFHNLSAVPLLAEYLKKEHFDGAYSLSPDKGAIYIAEAASKVLLGGYNFFEKTRDRKTGEITMAVKDLDIKGRKAVVFDDMISSGGTMAKAVEALTQQGAERVAAACTHVLYMPGAEEKIRKAGADPIIATNTIETPFSRVSVAGLIADKLRELS
ncbi:TPA: ribose-phosphate diphosphokinase [Candidatus Bathyarchaeota archaeon]|nr:ribose-phosphate diphosphokinase [Candidatus Bathyarchaeota archaeon]